MGTKNGWFRLMKKMLLRSHKDEAEKKKKWKWFSGGVKARRLGAIKASPTPAEAREELAAVAIVSQNHHDLSVGDGMKTRKEDPRTQIQDAAAITIQTAFRGCIARKALRALKGIVKLQAIIRGRAVRRQAINTLKCLQSIVNIQSQLRQTRLDAAAQGIWTSYQPHNLKLFSHNLTTVTVKYLASLTIEFQMDSNSPRRWDDSLLSKQDAESLFLSKKEAMMRRERIKGYASIHRRSEESDRNNAKGRWRYWLDQWVDTQLSKSREVEDLDSIFRSKEQMKLKKIMRQSSNEDLDSPTSMRRRKCHHRKQYSMGESYSFSGSPIVPAYMAATESAKAKARAGSSPKQRQWSFDPYSDSYSPCKNKVAVLASEDPITGRTGRIQERSSSFKGVPGPVKSSRILNDYSVDSAYSLPFWDRT